MDEINPVAIFIDGKRFGDILLIVVTGIDIKASNTLWEHGKV